MPLYEYQCEACEERFERIQKFSDPPVEVCPSCGGAVKKLLSSPAIQFKGSGWYITDYAKKAGDGKSATSKDSTSSESSASAASPAKESKESKQSKDASSTPAKKD